MKKTNIALFSALIATAAFGFEFHHPNLRDANKAAETAIAHIQEAQAANKGVEFGGHAEKAIELLKQTQQELMEAEKYVDMHAKR